MAGGGRWVQEAYEDTPGNISDSETVGGDKVETHVF